MQITTVQHRKCKSALRGTGATHVDLDGDASELTFTGTDKDGNTRVAGTIAADGALAYTQKPKASKPKAKAAKAAEPAAPAEDDAAE